MLGYITISQEKMTFLTANYGLSEKQVEAFADALAMAYQANSAEIELSWTECNWHPESPRHAMVEALIDAEGLYEFLDNYEHTWIYWDHKQELAIDLWNLEMPPKHSNWLKRNNKTSWYQFTMPAYESA